MRTRSIESFVLAAVMLAVCGIRCGAAEPSTGFLPGEFPFVPLTQPSQGNFANSSRGKEMSVRSIRDKDVGRGNEHHVGHKLDLTHGKIDPDSVSTIPHWSDSFTYNGLVYKYTMVGTDPKRGSTTTVIPTVLIPVRFVFADGNVFDATTDLINGQTAIQGIINSPIFQNYDFNNNPATYYFGEAAGLVKVGNTQWGDAFQRANFWDSVSTRAPHYHVLLGQPTVLPTQTINVPDGFFFYYADPVSGETLPYVDNQFLFDLTNPMLTAANVSANTLPILVWSKVTGSSFLGYHGVTSIHGNALQTFIATTYLPGNHNQDVYVLSHEIIEWLDDPFINNFTPGWNIPFQLPVDRCDSVFWGDLLEVGDPVNIFTESDVALPGGAYTYHVTEAVFIDFFTRASRSRSYNGQYSFFEIAKPYGILTSPSSPCTGHVEFTHTYIDFPGATFTAVTGMNTPGLAVGFYNDVAGAEHGFVFTGSKYSTLDYPGSLLTDPYKINDAGMIVGTFVDASGGKHGFSYNKGKWTQIDFPGASDTEVYGINASGTIVGDYDESQPVTHGFSLQNHKYQRIDTPFGTQSEAFAINDRGLLTGLGYTDSVGGPFTPFIRSNNSFSPFQFPGSILAQLNSINNSNDLAGTFLDPDGRNGGMVTVFGNPYLVFAILLGNDDHDRICGYTFDDTGRLRGFIGTLPLQRNAH